ncbi:MAG: ABC transporter substrate-binding protein [Chloroflexota bacterium]
MIRKNGIARSLAVGGTVLALCAVLPGSRLSHAAPAAVPPSGTFVTVLGQEPPTLDPAKSSAAVTAQLLRYIGDPLLYLDLRNKKYVPGLATKWSITHKGLQYDFVIRKDVQFQDGTALTAAAIVSTYKRDLSPEIKSPVAAGDLGQVKQIKATSKYTFRIVLKQPNPFLLYNLTTGWLVPLSPKAIAKEGDNFGRDPISTGPFKLQTWQTGSQIILVRNPKYHWGPSFLKNKGPAYIKTIVFREIKDDATQTAAFQAGEVDSLALPVTAIQQFASAGKYKIFKYPRQGVGLFLEFNVTKAPFDDIRVRQALNYAINKKPVLQIGLQGYGIEACGTLSPTIPGYWKGMCHYKYKYDPKKALQLLKQAGYTNHGGQLEKNGQPLTFTVITLAIDSWKRSATVLQQQLKDLGITMNIQTYDFGTELKNAQSGASQSDFLGYTYATSHIFYIWFDSSQIGTGLANSHFNSPKLDRLIAENDHTTNTKKRYAIDQKIQKFIADEALWVPLWTNNNYVAFQPRVHGEVLDKVGNLYLQDAKVSG